MGFSEKKMRKLSIINGLFSQIAMTFINNVFSSVISLIIYKFHKNEGIPSMDFFKKKSFSSISNLYTPTSIIGGLLIRYFGMKK